MIETITEEQLTPQQAEFWVRARQAVDMNNYPYAVSLLKALVKQLPAFWKAAGRCAPVKSS